MPPSRLRWGDVARSQLGREAVPVVIEQKQWVIADRLEVPVVGTAFLLPMHRALAGIHVEYDAGGVAARLGRSDQVAVHGHQPDEVVFTGQQFGLEPMERGGQGRTPVPPRRRSDQTKGRIGRETLRVVEVFIAGQAAVDR